MPHTARTPDEQTGPQAGHLATLTFEPYPGQAYLRTLVAEEATADDGAGLYRMCQFILMVAKPQLQP